MTPPNAPSGITGWNVYVGEASGKATRQNSQPLDLGTPWSMPGSGLVVGELLGSGQDPEVFKTVPRFLSRGVRRSLEPVGIEERFLNGAEGNQGG